jgi:hypothetical protein
MKIRYNASGFEFPEPGSYVATCLKVIDLGTQEGEFEGRKTKRQQMILTWELDCPMEDGRPFTISKWYTKSLHEKSKLRQDLAAWRGRDFTQEELRADFDPANLLDKSCMLTLVEDDKGRVRVGGVAKLPKGLQGPKLKNGKIYFSLEDYREEIFEILPPKLQELIMKSPEWKARGEDFDSPMRKIEELESDCPF